MTSTRNGTKLLNRMRRIKDGMIATTYRNCMEREGEAIASYIDLVTSDAIKEEGFVIDGKMGRYKGKDR